MSDITNTNNRIAKNTFVLYLRMIFLMLVNLYTSRVILDSLGVEDYGIYNVVAGFIAMFQTISIALVNANSRFINYEMGSSDAARLKEVFSTALNVNIGISVVFILLAETVGLWYVNTIMVIPDARLVAANWCYQFAIFNFCMVLINIPYRACIIAHEKLKTFAYVSIIEGLGQLAISYLILLNPFDRLVYYALLLFLLQNVIRFIYQFYCRKHFRECHYIKIFDVKLMKEILGFSSWNMYGNGASVIKNHGGNLILNFFFGPSVNAARGLANHVHNAVSGLATNFMMAITPQITQSYARKEYDYMLSLMNTGARFSYYLLLIICLPLIINTDFILHIWLKTVPEYTVPFIQLSLVGCMLYGLTRPLVTGQNATGNVKGFQLTIGTIELMNIPISCLVLHLGCSPQSVLIVSVVIEALSVLVRISILTKTIPFFDKTAFAKDVLMKCFLVTVLSSIAPLLLHYALGDSFVSFLVNLIVCFFSSLTIIYFWGLSRRGKKWMKGKICHLIKILSKRYH